ncbi:MAG: hypothetical protein PHF30_00230 [Bacilli bacterium]|nr:hypothetical protein [Bacilli bacterium]
MEALAAVLPIIIYFLLIILLIVVIILGIKLIITIDKVNVIAEDIREKVKSLNTIFELINFTSNKFSYLSTKVIDSITSLINKVFGLRSGKDDDDYV